MYMNAMFFSRNQESGESIDCYVTNLKNCQFGALKESLICDRIVFGIQDSSSRERLLRDAKVTLEIATEKGRLAKLSQVQLKQINANKLTERSPKKMPGKFPIMIDCK